MTLYHNMHPLQWSYKGCGIIIDIHTIIQFVQMQLEEVLPFTLSLLFCLLWDSLEWHCCCSEYCWLTIIMHLPCRQFFIMPKVSLVFSSQTSDTVYSLNSRWSLKFLQVHACSVQRTYAAVYISFTFRVFYFSEIILLWHCHKNYGQYHTRMQPSTYGKWMRASCSCANIATYSYSS